MILREKVESLSKRLEEISKDIKFIKAFIGEYKSFEIDKFGVINSRKTNGDNIDISKKIIEKNIKVSDKNNNNLYCLENEQLDKFDLFKIQYEGLPTILRK